MAMGLCCIVSAIGCPDIVLNAEAELAAQRAAEREAARARGENVDEDDDVSGDACRCDDVDACHTPGRRARCCQVVR
jgi:hypothetical protein